MEAINAIHPHPRQRIYNDYSTFRSELNEYVEMRIDVADAASGK